MRGAQHRRRRRRSICRAGRSESVNDRLVLRVRLWAVSRGTSDAAAGALLCGSLARGGAAGGGDGTPALAVLVGSSGALSEGGSDAGADMAALALIAGMGVAETRGATAGCDVTVRVPARGRTSAREAPVAIATTPRTRNRASDLRDFGGGVGSDASSALEPKVEYERVFGAPSGEGGGMEPNRATGTSARVGACAARSA